MAVVDDSPIVVAGTAAILRQFRHRVHVVKLDERTDSVSNVDVVLLDTFGSSQGLTEFVTAATARVVVFAWTSRPEEVRSALSHGAAGYLSKWSTAEQIVETVERVHYGSITTEFAGVLPGEGAPSAWPGCKVNLSQREAEVLTLICQGLSNQEIAETVFLGLNTVKTYIRTTYRKIGVTRRTQAMLWGLDNDLLMPTGQLPPSKIA